MDSQQILSSLNRINSALGVSWATTITALAAHTMHSMEIITVAILIGAAIASVHPATRLEREMRSTVWHLWMTVVCGAILDSIRRNTSTFVEQLAGSAIALMVVERVHVAGIVAESTHTFLVSSKYLFAESLSTAFAELHIGTGLHPVLALLLLYIVSRAYSPSKTIESAVGLMVFDVLGNIVLAPSTFPLNKAAIALILPLTGVHRGSFNEHLIEYSRWEASREIVAFCRGHEVYAAITCLVVVSVVDFARVDRMIQDAVHDITLLVFFSIFFEEATVQVQHVFMSNVIVPFVFSLTMLAIIRVRVSP